MDMQTVLWPPALWVYRTILAFPWYYKPLRPGHCSFVPLAKILWHASNPYPYSFSTHFTILSLFCLSLPLPFTSQLLSFVLFDPTDLYCYCILPKVFTWGILVSLFEIALVCVCSPYKKCAWWNVKCFFCSGSLHVHVYSLPFVNMNLSCVNEAACRCQPGSRGNTWSVIRTLIIQEFRSSLCVLFCTTTVIACGGKSISTFYTSIQGLVDLAGNL